MNVFIKYDIFKTFKDKNTHNIMIHTDTISRRMNLTLDSLVTIDFNLVVNVTLTGFLFLPLGPKKLS